MLQKNKNQNTKKQEQITQREFLRAVLAVFIVITGVIAAIFANLGMVVEGTTSATASNFLFNLVLLVVGYYFGQSSSSDNKDELFRETMTTLTKDNIPINKQIDQDNHEDGYVKDQVFNEGQVYE